MSLIIKGMKMPKNCMECMFRISYWKRALTPSGKIFTYGCMLNGKEINILEKRCKDCPIVEIPTPHGMLIDADTNVGSYVETWTCNCSKFGTQKVMAVDDLKYLPTIIEAEVSE